MPANNAKGQQSYQSAIAANQKQRDKYVTVQDANGNKINVLRSAVLRNPSVLNNQAAVSQMGVNPNLPAPANPNASHIVSDLSPEFMGHATMPELTSIQQQAPLPVSTQPNISAQDIAASGAQASAPTHIGDNVPFWQKDEFKQFVSTLNTPTVQGNTNVNQVIIKPNADPTVIPTQALPTQATLSRFTVTPQPLTAVTNQGAPVPAPTHIDTNQPLHVGLLPQNGEQTGQPFQLEKQSTFDQFMGSNANLFQKNIYAVLHPIDTAAMIMNAISKPAKVTEGLITAQPETNVIGNTIQFMTQAGIFAPATLIRNIVTGTWAGAQILNLKYQAARAQLLGNPQQAGQYEEAANKIYVNQVDDARKQADGAQFGIQNSWNQAMKSGENVDMIMSTVNSQLPYKPGMNLKELTAKRTALYNQLVEERNQNIRQAAVDSENRAKEQLASGNTQLAIKTMQQSIQLRIQADPMGELGAYTWVREPDRMNAFTQNVAWVQLQKGAPLTQNEISDLRDHFANSMTELTGQGIFDPMWLVPQKVWDLAFEPVKVAGGLLWKGINTIPVVGDLTSLLSRETFVSQGQKVINSFSDLFNRFAKSYSESDALISDTSKLGEFINQVNAEKLGPAEAEALFQESKNTIPGLNQFGSFKDIKPLVDAGSDPHMSQFFNPSTWSTQLQNAQLRAEAMYEKVAMENAVKELGVNADKELLKARANELLTDYIKNAKFMGAAITDFAGTAGDIFLDPRRIYDGSKLMQDSLAGNLVRTLRELAGKPVNEKILTDAEKMGGKLGPITTIGRALSEHGYQWDTIDNLAKAVGENLGPKNGIKQTFAITAATVENSLAFGLVLRDKWTMFVLSLNPAWVVRNYVDSAFRHVVYGGNLWDDIRALNFSMQRELESDTGLSLHAFSQALARLVDYKDTIATRSMMEGLPKGPFGVFSYWKQEFDRLGAERASEIAGNYFADAPVKPSAIQALIDGMRAIPGTMQDINSAMEYTLRLRMFHDEYFKALETLNPKVVDEIIGKANPELQDVMRQIWDAADGNPQKIKDLTESVLGQMGKQNATWAFIVPPNLKDSLPNMTLQDETLFVKPIRDSLQEMISNIQKSGRDVTKEDFNAFFADARTRLQDEIQAHAAQVYDQKGISGTMNTAAEVSKIPTEIGGANPKAVPEKNFALSATKSNVDAVEAAQRIKPTNIPSQLGKADKLLSNFSTAITPIADVKNIEHGMQVTMEGGKPVISIGSDLLNRPTKELYPMLRDATIKAMGMKDTEFLSQAGIRNSDAYVGAMKSFLEDPAKFLKNNEQGFLAIIDQMQSNPFYADMVGRLNQKYTNYESVADIYRYYAGLPEYDAQGIPKAISDLMTSIDAGIPIPADYRMAGLNQAQSTRRVGSLIQDASLPEEVRNNLRTFLDWKTNQQTQLHQFGVFIYPGPKNFSGEARSSAWNLFYRQMTDNYNMQAKMQSDLVDAFVRSPEEGIAMLDQFLGIDRASGKLEPDMNAFTDAFLKNSGIDVQWDANHNQIMNMTVNRADRKFTIADPKTHGSVFDFFYADGAHRVMDLNKPVLLNPDGSLPVTTQVKNAVRNIFELTDGEAKAYASMLDKHAKNWAAELNLPVEQYYLERGFQRVGTGNELDAKGLMKFQGAAVDKSEDGKIMLFGLANANHQSLIDSTAGLFYHDLQDMANKGSNSAMESLKRVNKFLESETGQKVKETLTSEQSTAFAKQFNYYLAKGELPDVNLYKPLNEMKSWLADVYTSMDKTTLQDKLAPDVKDMFTKVLTDAQAMPPKTNARQIQIMAKDAGIKFKTPDELLNIVRSYLDPAGAERLRIQDELYTFFKGDDKAVTTNMRIADSLAQYWSRQPGNGPASEFYGKVLSSIQGERLQDLVNPAILRQTGESQKNWLAALTSKMEEKATPEDAAAFERLKAQGDNLINEIIGRFDKTGITEQDIKAYLNNQLQTKALTEKYGLSLTEPSPADKFFNHIFGEPTTSEQITQDIAIKRYREEQAALGNVLSYQEAKKVISGNTGLLGKANPNTAAVLQRANEAPLPFMDKLSANFELGKVDIEKFINDTPILNYLRTNPVLFQQTKGAMEMLPDGRMVMHLFESGDPYTVAHELGHIWRQFLSESDLEITAKAVGLDSGSKFNELRPIWQEYKNLKASISKTPEQLARMKSISTDAKLYEEAEEKFARSFERYLGSGKAPTPELKPIFRQFREWLVGVYGAIKGSSIDVKISPELRGVFDNLLTSYVPAGYGRLGDVPVSDAEKAFAYFSKNPTPVQLNQEMDAAWKSLIQADNVISSFPETAKESPDALKAYLTNRIANEHPETASMYRDSLWRVEQFQDAMLNFHKGNSFQDLLFPAVNAGKMDDGIKTWIAHRNYMLSNYDQAFNALSGWNKYMNDAVDAGGTMFNTYTADQANELRNWATNAAKAKGDLVSSIINGGNVQGVPVESVAGKVNHVMLNYQYSNITDQFMKNWFPFWKFPSRSWPLWGETLATHPEIIAAYNKLMEASQSQIYQANATTTGGAPKPSMLGYFNIPGTDMWVNPMSPFSAKYVLDLGGLANSRYSNIDPNASPMDALSQQFMEASRVYGFSPAPWVIWFLKSRGWVNDNQVPPSPLIPQINLIPKWWLNDMVRMGRQYNFPEWATNAAQGTIDLIHPDVTGNDYVVENRVLSDALKTIQDPNTPEAQKLALMSKVQDAISQKGDNPMWLNAYKEESQQNAQNSAMSFFTGIYPKQFTIDDAQLLKLRDQNTMLRSSMNSAMQAQLFGLPNDPTQRWNYYKAYQSTPEGWMNRIRSDISYVTDAQGNVVDDPKTRANLLAQKLQQDSISQAHYTALDNVYNEYNKRLQALPIGAPYVQKSLVYSWLSEQLKQIDAMYPLTYERKYGTYQPVDIVKQNIENQWFQLLKSTEPVYDPSTGETYAQYQQRQLQWYADMPNFASDLMFGKSSEGAGFINKPSITDITGSLHTDQPLGQTFWTDLLAKSNFTGMQEWDLNNDNMFTAINKAQDALYYKTYWAAVTNPDGTFKKGADYEMAVQNWADQNNGGVPPTADSINQWLQSIYGNKFDPQQVADWVNASGQYSVTEQQSAAHAVGNTPAQAAKNQEIYNMQQDIWNVLSWGGPSKGDAALTFALQDPTAPAHSGNVNAWRESNGTLFNTDYSKLQSFHDALMWAAQSINLQAPSREQIMEYADAQQRNDQFQAFVQDKVNAANPQTSFTVTDPLSGRKVTLNTTAYALLQGTADPTIYDPQTGDITHPGTKALWEMAYGDGSLSKSEQTASTRNFKLANPDLYKIIQDYYHWYDVQVTKDPLWASYYGPTAMTSHRAYKPHTRRSKMSMIYTMPTVDTGPRAQTVQFPTGFQTTVGSALSNEIIKSQKENTPLSQPAATYLNGLASRHPEWATWINGVLYQNNTTP